MQINSYVTTLVKQLKIKGEKKPFKVAREKWYLKHK